MSLILSLDTSSSGCSVAVHEYGNLLAASQAHVPHSQGARLALMIEHVLENAALKKGDLSAVAVTSGPGSYTGLRIGTSIAKGLCFSLSIPLLAVDALTVMTASALRRSNADARFCPMLDARRMEVYCAVQDRQLNFVRPIDAVIVDKDSFKDLLEEGPVFFFGDGSAKCRQTIAHDNALFLDGIVPSAEELGFLASVKFESGKFEDLVNFEPLYLKEFLIKKSSRMDPFLNK